MVLTQCIGGRAAMHTPLPSWVNFYRNSMSALRPLSTRSRQNRGRFGTSVSGHVWTAPSWRGESSRRRLGSVQPCVRRKVEVIQWLFWQVGGLGPMAGQNHHFSQYAPTKIRYAIDRYVNETNRLYGVLNTRLANHAFIAGEYSITDMATYPWIVPHERQGQKLEDFPHLKRWFESIKARSAVVRAYDKAKEINTQPTVTEESKRILFGQTATILGR